MRFEATTRDGQDLTSFALSPLTNQLAASLLTGTHRQSTVDIDYDSRIDIPAISDALCAPAPASRANPSPRPGSGGWVNLYRLPDIRIPITTYNFLPVCARARA